MTYKIHLPEKKAAKGKGKSSIEYFEKKEFNASVVDYFTSGNWKGQGAERMGLHNEPILKGELEQWGKTFHPKIGEKLGKSSKNGLDDAYLQSVFSPPKDFSLIYFLDKNLGQEQLEEDWNFTLKAMYEFMNQYGETRINSANDLEKIGLVIAEFKHETARATDKNGVEIRPDPQLHAHMLISRLGIDKEGKGKKFENRKLLFNQIQVGTFGRAVLADRLRNRGYAIEKHTEYEERADKNGIKRVKINSFRVVGITQEQRDFFSNRSKEINLLEEHYGTHSTKARDMIANTNKKAKKEFSREELITIWKNDADKIGLTNEYLQSLKTSDKKSILSNLKTDEELFESIITKDTMFHKDIMARLYEYQQYTGIKAEDIFNRWVGEKKIEKSSEFKYKSNIELKNKDKKRRTLNLKIKNNPSKVFQVANIPHLSLDGIIDGSISNQMLYDIESRQKEENEFNVLLDKEDKKLEREEKERIRIFSNLPMVKRSANDEARLNDKREVDTQFQILDSIKGVEGQIGNMHQQLLDPKVSAASKARIAAKMEELAAKLVMLKKKKMNAIGTKW